MDESPAGQITFHCEPFSRHLVDEIEPLLIAHYREIAHYQDIPLAPDLGRYEGLSKADALRIFTVRVAGKLCGYGVFIVSLNLHYSTSRQSAQDILYVSPEYRGAGLGRKLLAYCDVMLAREGVQMNAHHVKAAHPKLGEILSAMGYEPMETVWVKRLDFPLATVHQFPVPTHAEVVE